MITIQHENNLTVIGIFSTFEVEDFMRIETEIEQQLHAHGAIDLLVDLRGMMGYTLDTALEDIRFTRQHSRDVGRIAIFSENNAVVWTALLSRLFVKADIRVFDSESGAREWLKAGRVESD
ncbi:MAG: STAS/SEC14 domain-containing protein [Betaproteobacteria bacterium]